MSKHCNLVLIDWSANVAATNTFNCIDIVYKEVEENLDAGPQSFVDIERVNAGKEVISNITKTENQRLFLSMIQMCKSITMVQTLCGCSLFYTKIKKPYFEEAPPIISAQLLNTKMVM